jgi:hypothetical protein
MWRAAARHPRGHVGTASPGHRLRIALQVCGQSLGCVNPPRLFNPPLARVFATQTTAATAAAASSPPATSPAQPGQAKTKAGVCGTGVLHFLAMAWGPGSVARGLACL